MLIKKPIIYCVREHIVCILSHFLKSCSRFWFTFTCRNLNAAFACMRSTFFFGMQLSSFMHCDSFSNSGPLQLVLLWGCVCLLVSAEHNIYCCLVFYFYFLTECCLVMLPTFEYFTFFQSSRGHGWLNCLQSNEWIKFLDLVNLSPILWAERGVVGPAHVIAPFIQWAFYQEFYFKENS